MLVVPGVIALAVVAGYVLGGRLRGFDRLRVHRSWLAFIGLGLQIFPARGIGGVSASTVGAVMLAASYIVLLAFLAVNRWVPAARLMALGLLLNLTVVGLNGGMPVSPRAVELAGGTVSAVSGAKHHLATEDDLLPILGDTIPVPRPIGIVLSIGDVLLYAGMFWFVIQVMRGRSRENPRPLVMWFLSYRGAHSPSHWRIPAHHRAGDPATADRSGSEP